MNTKQNGATVAMVAVVLMAAALTPGLADAHPAIQGKLNLPCTTHWGSAVLPAGEYTFTVKPTSKSVDVIELRGAANFRHMAFHRNQQGSEKSSLTLAKSNGIAVARTLYLADIERSFTLPETAKAKELLTKSQPIEMRKIAVVAAE